MFLTRSNLTNEYPLASSNMAGKSPITEWSLISLGRSPNFLWSMASSHVTDDRRVDYRTIHPFGVSPSSGEAMGRHLP